MRFAASLAFAVILAVPAASAQLDVAFTPPGQWRGEATLEGAWLIATLDNPAESHLHVAASTATSTNHTIHWTTASLLGEAHVSGRPVEWPPEEDGRGAIDAVAAFAKPGRASVVVFADSITVVTTAGEGEIAHLPDGAGPREAVGLAGRPGSFVRAPYDVSGDVTFASPDAPATMEIHASGVQRVEWINASIQCQSSFCPSGGGVWGVREAHAGSEARSYALSFTELATDDATLGGILEAQAWAVGAGSMDARVQGWLRLPAAELAGDCACYEEDQSVQGSGNLSLTGLTPSDSRLAARLGGDASWLHLDEQDVDPTLLGGGMSGPVAAAIGAGLLLNLAAALALQSRNRNRQRIREAIVAEPGITFRSLMRRLDLANRTVRHHVDKLLQRGSIVEMRAGRTHHYFENHGKYGQRDRRAQAALQDEAVRLLLAFLHRVGRMREKAALRHAEAVWSWNPSTTQRRLRRLVDAGLVSTTKHGGRWYEARAPAGGCAPREAIGPSSPADSHVSTQPS